MVRLPRAGARLGAGLACAPASDRKTRLETNAQAIRKTDVRAEKLSFGPVDASRGGRMGKGMTTLPDRPNTALLIVDVQTRVVANAHDRDAVVGRIAALVDDARAADTPVIWVRHEDEQLVAGTDDWQIAKELSPAADEPIVAKRWGDSFEETNLEALLADLKVGRLVVAGAMTDQCIRSTLHGASAPAAMTRCWSTTPTPPKT